MTRAAKILYMTQPSVSQAITELEHDYGVRLFERLNHRLFLTAAGEKLVPFSRQILNLSEQTHHELADFRSGGMIRIGASLTIGAYMLPGLVSAFRKQHPAVDTFLRVDNTGLIEKMVFNDQLDLGLVEGPVASDQLVEKYFCSDTLVFIISPQHPLSKQDRWRIQDLEGQVFIAREEGSGTQRIFENAMQETNVSWKTVGVFNNNEAIKKAVGANLGMAIVSKISIEEEVRQGTILPLEVEGISLKRKLSWIYHRQKFFTQAMHMFLKTSHELINRELSEANNGENTPL